MNNEIAFPLQPLSAPESWLELKPVLTRDQWLDTGLRDMSGKAYMDRCERIRDIGFSTHSAELIDELVAYIGDRRVFEVGAGTGHLARVLFERGISICAVDNQKGYCTQPDWWTKERLYFDVLKMDPTQFPELPGEIVLMVWPCYNTDFAERIARLLKPGQILLYCGESKGGCTGDDGFFDHLDAAFEELPLPDALYQSHIDFYGLHEHWWAYTPKIRRIENGQLGA